jgi:hypothetical protein
LDPALIGFTSLKVNWIPVDTKLFFSYGEISNAKIFKDTDTHLKQHLFYEFSKL